MYTCVAGPRSCCSFSHSCHLLKTGGFGRMQKNTDGTCSKYALLGLLAKIKCSICSYQCNNWYLYNVETLFINVWKSWIPASLLPLHTLSSALHYRLVTTAPRGTPSSHLLSSFLKFTRPSYLFNCALSFSLPQHASPSQHPVSSEKCLRWKGKTLSTGFFPVFASKSCGIYSEYCKI